MTSPAIDPARFREKQSLIAGYMTGMLQSGIVYLGIELGLFSAMHGGTPATAEELAGRLGLSPRFVLEWLRAATAGHVIEYAGDDQFFASPEVDRLLAEEKDLASLQSFFVELPARLRLWAEVPDAFRTGIGFDWDSRGSEAIEWMEAGFRNWYEQVLIQRALPALDGLVERLSDGISVADVGCGAGIALLQMARAFPKSRFHGYDSSANAIARAKQNGAGIPNLSFHHVPEELLPADHTLTLVTTFDCMHDMTRPLEVARAIRAALREDGHWFIADIRSFPTFDENLASNPQSARMYATSVFGCLQSGMSEPGGAGLGTFGLPEPRMRELATSAGFTRFRKVELDSPVNAYYEARP